MTEIEATEEILRRAEEIDQRRQHQIENQIGTINRLLAGATYEEEIQELHENLASAQQQRDAALQELSLLRGRS